MKVQYQGSTRRVHFVPYIRPAPQGAPRPNPHPGHARAPALSRPMDHALMRTHPIQLAGTVRADSEDLAGADFYVRRDDVANEEYGLRGKILSALNRHTHMTARRQGSH